MSKELTLQRVDLFGDICKISFDPNGKKVEGIGMLSATDTSRLIAKIAEHYGKAKTKRGKRIFELADELAKLVKQDGGFAAETHALVANGMTVVLDSDRKVIACKNDY